MTGIMGQPWTPEETDAQGMFQKLTCMFNQTVCQAVKADVTAADNSMQPHQLMHSNNWSHSIQVSTTGSTAWPGTSILATPSPLLSPLLLSTPLITKSLPKCKCMLSTFKDSPLSGKPSWTPAMQSEFGKDFCKLLIVICAPWNSANNPQMHLFIQKWIPGGVVPDW